MKHHDARNTACQQLRIARSGVGEIFICPDCGVVQVALQYFSMRFELEAFKALQNMLCEAQSKIDQQVETLRVAREARDEFAALEGDGASKSVVH